MAEEAGYPHGVRVSRHPTNTAVFRMEHVYGPDAGKIVEVDIREDGVQVDSIPDDWELMTKDIPEVYQAARDMLARVTPVHMGPGDFEQLCLSSMRWASEPRWEEQVGRFEPIEDGEAVNWAFGYMYEVERWADVVLARAFLDLNEHEYQVLSDEAEGGGHYVIVTNYPGAWETLPASPPS